MATNVDIKAPVYTAAEVLHAMRHYLEYILASEANTLEEVVADNTPCLILVEALECLRTAAGEISLERLLLTQTKPTRLPLARPSGYGPHLIETRGTDSFLPPPQSALPQDSFTIPFGGAAP